MKNSQKNKSPPVVNYVLKSMSNNRIIHFLYQPRSGPYDNVRQWNRRDSFAWNYFNHNFGSRSPFRPQCYPYILLCPEKSPKTIKRLVMFIIFNFVYFFVSDFLLFSSVEATPSNTDDVVVGVAVAVPVLVLLNAVLLFVIIKRRAIKGSSSSSSASGKTSLNGGDSKNSASEGNFWFFGGWVYIQRWFPEYISAQKNATCFSLNIKYFFKSKFFHAFEMMLENYQHSNL